MYCTVLSELLNGSIYSEITVFVSLLLLASSVKSFERMHWHSGDILLSYCCAQLKFFSVVSPTSSSNVCVVFAVV